MAQAQRPDAIIAVSDVLAVGVMHAIQEAGLCIPDDVAVVGFDGIPFTSSLNPPLTTIEQPMGKMGARSVQLLLESIRHPQATATHDVLPWKMVERRST